jgi:hypothetical protein
MLMKLTTALNIDAWISFALPDVDQHEWAWRFEPAVLVLPSSFV